MNRGQRHLAPTIAVTLAALFAALLVPAPAQAQSSGTLQLTYDFEGDDLGQPPAGVSAVAGKAEVALDLGASKGMRPTEAGRVDTKPHGIKLAAFAFDAVVGSDMTVTWKESALLGGDRHSMTLRHYGEISGYIFTVSNVVLEQKRGTHHNEVAIYRATDDNHIELLASTPLLGAPVRSFEAAAVDRQMSDGTVVTDLRLSASDDGETFTPVLELVDDDPLPAGGLEYVGGWEGTDPTRTVIDDVRADFMPTPSVVVTSPVDHQVLQRDVVDTADIAVTGTYRLPPGYAAPAAIEARWDGGTWSTLDVAPTDGSFQGVLSGLSQGQGRLEVRFANDTAVVAERDPVGIGDVFVIAGQSNAAGFGKHGQVYTPDDDRASMFSVGLRWQELEDPVGGVEGSVWPLVASHYTVDQGGVPVAFVPTAVGGTSITQWQPGDKYYERMLGHVAGAGGGVRAVLFWQGETDAVDGMSESAYGALLDGFAAGVESDLGVPVVVAQIGEVATDGANLDPIRAAQRAAWDAGGNVLAGPTLYDVDLGDDSFDDGTHFRSNDDLQVAARRWWAALDAHFFDGSDGRGPQLASATRDASGTQVTVTFSDATLPLEPTTGLDGFVVEEGGSAVSVTSSNRTADDTIVLDLGTALSGPATLSLGKGHTAAGRTVPTDSTGARLPAESFVDVAIGS